MIAGDVAYRSGVLRDFGAGPAEVAELLAYNENSFHAPDPADGPAFPLPDEPFVEAWAGYAAEAERRGAYPVLRERLVQLRFPIAAGISSGEAYQAAVRRGTAPPEDGSGGVVLEEPDRLRLFLHPTAAGRIPVLVAATRADFVALVRALARRNEPDEISPAMGACIVAGYNNWDRVAELRRQFERGETEVPGASDWGEAFRALRERRELYQDRFVILSSGPYSGVPAAELGLGEEAWRERSLTLRLEHECAHYFTRRVFGSMRNSLLDELIADYVGIVAAEGRYRPGWFLRFMGLEHPSRYRAGGRLENYRGRPPLSDGAFTVLQGLVRAAAERLEEMDREIPEAERGPEGRARVIAALTGFTLEELAGDGAAGAVRKRLEDAAQWRGRRTSVHAEAG